MLLSKSFSKDATYAYFHTNGETFTFLIFSKFFKFTNNFYK